MRVAASPDLARGALLALALALPIALGSSEIVVAPVSGGIWRGILDPPSLGRIALAVGVGIVAATGLRRWRHFATPLLALWVAALPLVPLFTGHGLTLLLFQGPSLLLVGLAALAVGIVRRWSEAPPGSASAWTLFALAFLFYVALTTRLPGAAGPQGDEPHYLVMAESLRSDADLDLRDEHDSRAYRSFYAGRLGAHKSSASPKGTTYSIHAPGLPLLILPAYAALGFRGAQWLIAALVAFTGALVFRLVRDVTGQEWTARAAWAAFVFLPPMAFYAVSIYPEAVAALATALFLLTSRTDPSRRAMFLAATLAAALPWLHPKFLPLAGLGLGLTLVRRGPRVARVVAAGLALAGLVGLLALFHSTYGRASLSAAYGLGFDSDVSLARIPWGLAALLLDRQFGLLALTPLWILAIPGCLLLFGRASGDTLRAVLFAAVTLGVSASFSMWWGGTCPPARFVVPALPALAVLLAPALARWRTLAAALFGASLGVTLVAAAAPRAIHNRPDGESALLKVLAPALSLDALWPSFLPKAGPRETGVHERRAVAELIQAWGKRRLVGSSGSLRLQELSLPLDLPGAPWELAPRETRFSRKLDLPPGDYRLEVASLILEAGAGDRVVRLGVFADEGELAEAYLAEGGTSLELLLELPNGASRLALAAEGLQGRVVIDGARLWPEQIRGVR